MACTLKAVLNLLPLKCLSRDFLACLEGMGLMNWKANQVAHLVHRQAVVDMTSITGSTHRAPARRVGTTRANGAQGRRSRLALTRVLNRHPVTPPRATPVARGGAARRGEIR